MADDEVKVAWEKAEKAITKGKGESALKILRDVDPNGTDVLVQTKLFRSRFDSQATPPGSRPLV